MAQILENCILTHRDSEVEKTYDVKFGSEIYHTGIDITADDVYCPCQGVCIYTGYVDNYPSCTVQYSDNICLRFLHLLEVQVEPGQTIEYDQIIGIADKFVHFEYLTSEKIYPSFRVFFQAAKSYYMYKHDPMLVLSGNVVFDNHHIAKPLSEEEFTSEVSRYMSHVKSETGKELKFLPYFGLRHSDLFEDLS